MHWTLHDIVQRLDADKLPAIKTYLQQLNEQVVNLQQTHDQLEEHSELDYKNGWKSFNEKANEVDPFAVNV